MNEFIARVEQWAQETMQAFSTRGDPPPVIELLQMQLAELQFIVADYKPPRKEVRI